MKNSTYPRAPKHDQILTFHNDRRNDPYFWLKQVDHPETKPYLEAENRATEEYFQPLKTFEEQMFEELKARIVKDDSSPPAKSDDYFYYSRTTGDGEQSIHCRKYRSVEAPEEIILDCNVLAKGFKSFSLGLYDVSPRHDILAYASDTNGAEIYSLYFKNLKTDELLPDRIEGLSYGSAWCRDNKTFYYVTQDENQRPYRLWRHCLGQDAAKDELLFEEKDSQYFLSCSLSESEEYIFLNRHSHASNEYYYVSSKDPKGRLELFSKLEDNVQYEITHREDFFYLLTNKNAKTFRLCKTPVGKTSAEHWQTVLEAHPERTLESLYAFKDFMIVSTSEKALKTLSVFNYQTEKLKPVPFPDPIYQVGLGVNYEFESEWVRLNYSSLVQPVQTFDFNVNTQEKVIRKIQQIPTGYDAKDYVSERIWAKSHDGTEVPISLVYKKSLRRQGPQPTLLYGYGSYGSSVPTSFNTSRLSLLDRGFIYAIAHIRGGSEMGRMWYENAKFLKKKNTFLDFIACTEHLIRHSYAEPKTLAISGGSAGGMLMGAVINMHPELFNTSLAIVPFVDVLNTMLDSSLPLTPMEYQEWGNPETSKEYYDYIKSYSPYDNVTAKAYPNLYIKAGLNDPRVTYWEPAKWCAKLRELKTDSHVLLLETDMHSGHRGASGRFEYLKEIARQYTFILATCVPGAVLK